VVFLGAFPTDYLCDRPRILHAGPAVKLIPIKRFGGRPWTTLKRVALAAVPLFLLSQPLAADMPERNMANVQIEDQGSRMLISWHFFHWLLPRQFILHEKQDELISMPADPHLLEQKLSEIAKVAFDFKVDGSPVQPTLLKLTLYPNNSCFVFMSVPGHPRADIEMSAPVLKYFPPGYFLSVTFRTATGTKGAFFGTKFPPVVHFQQGERPRPPGKPFFSQDFIAEWGAAWVNYNWILTCLILLLMRQARQIAVLVASIVVCWIALCFASVLFDFKLTHKIPQIALCVPTLLVCLISVRFPKRWILLTLVAIVAGLMNACFDLQQIPLSVPAQTVNALAGLAFGFAGGIALVLLVLVPLWWECSKFPGFQESWAPRLSWIVAVLSVLLPLQKWLFG
jgi:hypothetical protein